MCDEIRKIRKLKSATTFDEQLNKIKDRGCIIGDEVWAKDILKQINYYRLTAYFLPYKELDETYAEGTTFNNMYRTYEFDRKLRHLLFSTIEEIEIMLRAQLPKELVSEFKEICKEKNISQASVLKSAIEKFIEENK